MSEPRDIDVACLGEAALDLRAPEGAVLEDASTLRLVPGGGAVNTAIELARLGARPALCAAFGDDPIGRGLKNRIGAAGVDVRFVRLAPLRTGLVFMGASREQEAAIADKPGCRPLPGARSFVSYRDPDEEARALSTGFPEYFGARLVHLSGLVPTRHPLHVFRQAIAAAHRDGSIVVLDLNAQRRFWQGESLALPAAILHGAHIIKCAQNDLPVMGLSSASDLRAHARPDAVIISTSGAGPVVATSRFGEIERAPLEIADVDPTGAGDAFCAGLLAELARHPERLRPEEPLDPELIARSIDRAIEASTAYLLRRLEEAN